jgi:hypothetical protein
MTFFLSMRVLRGARPEQVARLRDLPGPQRSGQEPATLDNANQYDDDCDHQQNVDEPAYRVRRDHPEQPHQYEYYGDSPEHGTFPYCACGYGATTLTVNSTCVASPVSGVPFT